MEIRTTLLGGDSAKVKNENHQLLKRDFAKFKTGKKKLKIIAGDYARIKTQKLGFPKQKLWPNF